MSPISERDDDLRLERELRGLLGDRDPGLAPYGLRERVDRVPERDAAGGSVAERARRAIIPALGLAAAVAILAIGLQVLGSLPFDGAAGASPGSPPASQAPGATAAPAFDPHLDGPGISASEDASLGLLVVFAMMTLGLVALALHGWRRLLALVPAAALVAYALVAALLPVTILVNGYGPGLNVEEAPTVPGSNEVLWYELAPADGRFSIFLLLSTDAPVPVRLNGILDPAYDQEPYYAWTWQAVWLDEQTNGGATGPARPLTPTDIPRHGRAIWLVGEASPCAMGSAFDPRTATEFDNGFIGRPVTIRISVLGWPRTVDLTDLPRLVEPITNPCPGSRPAPAASPGPSGA